MRVWGRFYMMRAGFHFNGLAMEDKAASERRKAAADRALAEAEARRKAPAKQPPEKGGPKGPEPTRYGDWEKKGIASDF